MIKIKNRKLFGIKVGLILLLIFGGVASEVTLLWEIEKQTRKQLTVGLDQLRYCVTRLKQAVGLPVTENSISSLLYSCAYEMHIGTADDIFAYNLNNGKILMHNYHAETNRLKFIDNVDEICTLVKTKTKCDDLLSIMKQGVDSNGDGISWLVHPNKIEWVEWAILPSEDSSYVDELNSTKKPFKVGIVQGAKAEDKLKAYSTYRYVLHGSMTLVMFIVLVILYMLKRTEDDT